MWQIHKAKSDTNAQSSSELGKINVMYDILHIHMYGVSDEGLGTVISEYYVP